MAESPVDPVKNSNVQPSKQVGGGEDNQVTPGSDFKSLMQQPGIKQNSSDGVTPLQLMEQSHVVGQNAPSMETLVAQINSTSSALGDVQNQLNTKNLNLNRSQRFLLKSKLKSANQNIRSAAEKSTNSPIDPPQVPPNQNPVERFLGLVTDGQTQLDQVQGMVKNMKLSGGSLSPSQLLGIQVKLARAQQEIEYSSVLLSKAIDGIKTLFNIQI